MRGQVCGLPLAVHMQYAEIVVNVPLARLPLPAGADDTAAPSGWLDQTFTYHVPEGETGAISAGHLVWVPFGPRRLQGIVLAVKDTAPVETTRAVQEIVQERPLLAPWQIELARWIAHRYLAPLAACVWMLLPPGIEDKIEILYQLGSEPAPSAGLSENQRAALELVLASPRGARLPPHLRAAAAALVERGILVRNTRLRPGSAHPKQVKAVRLVGSPEAATETLSRMPRMNPRLGRIVDFLRQNPGPVWISAVYAATDAKLTDLQRLEAAGIVQLELQEMLRDSLAGRRFERSARPTLTEAQAAALTRIRAGLNEASPGRFLLHGVTGSGKTEIYLNAIEETLKQGRQAIALVPEIALTPQTIQRFGARFGERIGVIHSELSHGERYDTWRRARDGKLDVVIGPRSALFAPLPRLGLIVIDEEHEPSYKQEPDPAIHLPTFHAREAALEIARLNRAAVILGSATPDVETYWRAQQGEFELIELPQRLIAHGTVTPVRFQELPPVEIVDLRAELRAGNTSIFSRSLEAALRAALAAHEQAILFLNRRGTATSVVCRECGEPVRCPRCHNPFTLHELPGQAEPQLICHHCGKQRLLPRLCPHCGSKRIRGLGLGTEKLEQLVHAQFPGARTLRWDWDMTRGYEAHEKILEAFRGGAADILIGTQMIAKGLDLPRVTLVGVINADTGLNLPDLRAGERTFQLLTQVAGRAGRSALGGKVVIQTYSPEHYAIQAAARHDYAGFYTKEIEFRRLAAYPPFRPLVRLIGSGAPEAAMDAAAAQLAEILRDQIRRQGLGEIEVIGPAPAFYGKWRSQYRRHLLLRGREAHELLARVPLPSGWRIDVDPMSML